MDSTNLETTDLPLCVDLDGTLVRSDLLVEACLSLLLREPLTALRIPAWLSRGKPYLKEQMAQRVRLDPALLPYRTDLLDYVTKEHDRGRLVVLATASHRILADQVAAHLGIFDRVLATEGTVNLSGVEKNRRLAEEFGVRGFVYAGNERKDLHVWRGAQNAIVVDVHTRLEKEIEAVVPISARFPPDGDRVLQILRALRLHQWLKNLLIFVPLIAAHRLSDVTSLIDSLLAFFSFSLCASSAYLLNDLWDLSADRRHPRKRFRPFASGRADVRSAIWLIPLLLGVSFAIAMALPILFLAALAGYWIATVFYSLWAKRRAIFDVLLLSGLYTLRILAGSAVNSIVPSFWLLAFSMSIFLSLALVKRYSELLPLSNAGGKLYVRGYLPSDSPVLQSMGMASGYMAVLVLALYINSPDISNLYETPQLMWLTCPIVLFWISRVWLKTQRGEMDDDPIVWALRDRQSQISALSLLTTILTAT